jgi:hypothetical protein
VVTEINDLPCRTEQIQVQIICPIARHLQAKKKFLQPGIVPKLLVTGRITLYIAQSAGKEMF